MANQRHLARLRRDVEQWNEWRKQNSEIRPDLKGANLSGTNLTCAHLSYADLSGANLVRADLRYAHLSYTCLHDTNFNGAILISASLRSADLSNADLSNANLRGANLIYANLQGSNLRGADLRGTNQVRANLSGADLRFTNLSGAHLGGAELHGAKIGHTVFARQNLSTTIGLSEIDHFGPSQIELHTVQLPRYGKDIDFLRGSGLLDIWIALSQTNIARPIQYHSCFISYSGGDRELAYRLHTDLQAQGVHCWFAPEDLKIGDKIRDRIDAAIHLQDKLLLLLSGHALASEWVEDEVEAALEKERRQQREVLFPVRLDNTVMMTNEAWAAKLRRSRHIGDFTNWTDPHAYKQAFERLLRDPKAQG